LFFSRNFFLSFLCFASVLDAVTDTLALLSFFVCSRAQSTKNERNNANEGKERKKTKES
jgi:hypothetical protein